MTARVLVTRHVYPQAISLLEPHAELDYRDSPAGLAPEALRAAAADKHAIVSQLTDTLDAALMDAAPELRVVANIAVGYDNVDVAAASERGIVVTHTPEVLTETTADLAFALLLATARRIPEAERFLRAGRWRRWEVDLFSGRDVHGRTLGILGLGRIGRAVARRARGFAMRVLYHGPRRHADAVIEGYEYVERETLFREADFLSIHVPLNAATRHAVGREEFALMKPTAILVNTARGAVLDEHALAEALAGGRLAGAGLDVFEHEPAVPDALRALDNVVLLPHIGSASVGTRVRMCELAAENALAVLRGERPPDPVNPEVLSPAR